MIIFGRRKDEHKFRGVSKRGRAAYLILCFEECLSFYGENIGLTLIRNTKTQGF